MGGLFTKETAEPFAYARAASLLASLLSVLGIAARTWHAFRVTLACAIFGTGLPNKEALCQALLRWKSPASVAIYAKMAPSDYATAIERSNATCAHPQRDLELPDFDPSGQAADLQLAVDQLERDLRGAKAALAATNSADAGSSKDPVSSAAVTASAPATASAPRTEPKAAKPRKRGGAADSSRPSKGARVEIFWTDEKEWFAGTVGSTRRSDGATRIAYDATPAWPPHVFFHVLADERWRALA